MRIGIAADHGGFALKEDLRAQLAAAGHNVIDFGAHKLDPNDDFPNFVIPLSQAVASGKVERGVAVCGSGVGAAICANKIPGVRALNGGKLENARTVESITALLIGLNIRYKVHSAGVRFTGLPVK